MIIYLKNPNADEKSLAVASIADLDAYQAFLRDSFDIMQVNSEQFLLIMKEIGNKENPRAFFMGCFPTTEQVSAHISSMFEVLMEESDANLQLVEESTNNEDLEKKLHDKIHALEEARKSQ